MALMKEVDRHLTSLWLSFKIDMLNELISVTERLAKVLKVKRDALQENRNALAA